MIRTTEMVLPGHPDKFCDQVADAVLTQCMRVDPYAYCQVEVSVWYDQVWLSGGIVTRKELPLSLSEIVRRTGKKVGYTNGNFVNINNYKVTSTVCQQVADPRPWVSNVNDQCIAIGYAGYDAKTRYLPPEHYLGHILRKALIESYMNGPLKGHGPDDKLLLVMREEPGGWILELVLITLQQKESVDFMVFCGRVERMFREAYDTTRAKDKRWNRQWKDVEILINPNGPFINGGSDGDNGQTGRKLVVDYYGPRVPIGGGALCGKDLLHIDRAAAYRARQAAVMAVQSGAHECLVRLVYAPNIPEPLEIIYEMDGRGNRQHCEFFRHESIAADYRKVKLELAISCGGHFFEPGYPWNMF